MSAMYPVESPSIVKPEFAADYWFCPATGFDAGCKGPACPLWRWAPLTTKDGPYEAAVIKLAAEGMTNAQASKEVGENRAKYGVPEKPYRGWCGLGGKPEA